MKFETSHIEKDNRNAAIAMKVSVISIIINLGLSLLKLLAGIFAESGAMISDAVHSASDVLSTFVVIAGVRLANKKPDSEHPYGHERMECVAAVVLAVVLAGTGIGIGISGIQKIASSDSGKLSVPGITARSWRTHGIIARMRSRPSVLLRVFSVQGWGSRFSIRSRA